LVRWYDTQTYPAIHLHRTMCHRRVGWYDTQTNPAIHLHRTMCHRRVGWYDTQTYPAIHLHRTMCDRRVGWYDTQTYPAIHLHRTMCDLGVGWYDTQTYPAIHLHRTMCHRRVGWYDTQTYPAMRLHRTMCDCGAGYTGISRVYADRGSHANLASSTKAKLGGGIVLRVSPTEIPTAPLRFASTTACPHNIPPFAFAMDAWCKGAACHGTAGLLLLLLPLLSACPRVPPCASPNPTRHVRRADSLRVPV